jgi:hypothetical protein
MSKLFNRKFIKVSREHYGQLTLLVDYLTFKAGGKVEIPNLQEMQRQIAGYDAALVPDLVTNGATLILRKTEKGLSN